MLEIDIKAHRGSFGLEATLEVANGVTALVGSSGAGKSSLLRVIAGLERPDAGAISNGGEVWFDHVRRQNWPPAKRRIGMVFQEPRLLPHKSVIDNIKLGARGSTVSDSLLTESGCDALMDKPVSGLSGGEQQRVMLARALAGRPNLLLLDEPLSALDQESRDNVTGLLARVLPRLDVPVIYVTHAFDEAARLARRFVRMEAGRVIASGSALEVLAGQGAARQEAAVSSLLEGKVISIEVGGIARISTGGQTIEVPSGRLQRGQDVVVRLWARDLILAHQKPKGISARNCLLGRIGTLEPVAENQVRVEVLVDDRPVSVLVMSRTARDMDLQEGMTAFLVFKTASLELTGVRTSTGDPDLE